MIAGEKRESLALGVSGLVLQIAGNFLPMFITPTPGVMQLRRVLLIGGTTLLIVGLLYYARAKGRHPAWGLMGFLSLIGLIVLACLKDHARDGQVEPPLARPAGPPPIPREPRKPM
jgi:hypothetical protein